MCVQFSSSNYSYRVGLNGHLHLYLWVGLVVMDNKVLKLEVIDVSHFTSYF